MRHFIWLGACLSDVVLVMALVTLWWKDGFSAGTMLMGYLALLAWKQAGGFDNWRPSMIKQFFRNMS